MADSIQILISALLDPATKVKLQKELDAMSAQASKSVKTASAKVSASAKTSTNTNTISAQTKSMQKYTAEINNAIHAYKKGEKGVESYNNQLKKLMTYKNFEKLAWKQQEQVVSEYSKSLKIVASNQDAVDKKKTGSVNKARLETEAQLALEKKRFTMLEQINRLQAVKPAVYKDPNVQALLGSTKSAIAGMQVGDTESIQNGEKALAKFNTQQQATTKAFANSNTAGKNFFAMIKANAAKVGEWLISTTLIYAPLRALQGGIKYIMELDNALNEIRIVTNMTQVEVENLAKSYGQLAIEMSVSTKEITVQAAELYRQGLATKDVEERMKGIIIYSKISGITIEESGKIITATMNATGRSVEDVINVFALLGDKTAAGADEIGEALQKVAATADNAGVSMEAAAAMIATISSVTRESAQNIGNSLKSIMSRYASIKAKGFNDEDSTKINDVTKALTAVGIQAVDSQGQLRNFTDVLNDLGGKWDTLTRNEQAYIATTAAGTFQRNRFITLMQNYSKYTQNYKLALDSAGSAQQKFDTYQESTQAHLDKMTASWQNLIKTIVDSALIKTLLDIGAEAANAVPKILLLVGAVVAFSSAIKLALSSTAIQGWLGGISVALSSLTKGFISTTAAASATSVAFGILGSVGIMAVVTALALVVGEVVKTYQKFRELEKSIKDVDEAYKEFAKTPSEESMANLDNAVQRRIDLLDTEIAKLKERQEFLDKLKPTTETPEQAFKRNTEIMSHLNDTTEEKIANLESKKQKELEKAAYNRQIAEEKLWDAQVMTKKTLESTIPIYEEVTYDMEKYDDAMSGATEAVSTAKDELSDLADIYDQVQKGEEISSSNLLDLISKYPQLAKQFQNVNDITRNKGEFLKQVWEIEKQVRINEATAAYESAEAQLKAYEDVKFAALNTAKSMGMPMEYYLMAIKSVGGKEYEDMMNKVQSIKTQIKVMEGLGIKDFSPSSKKTSVESKDYQLPESIQREIERLDNKILESETKSKEEQIKALEVKEKYLEKIKKQIKDTKTLNDITKDILGIQKQQLDLQDDINKEMVDSAVKAQETITKIVKDEVDKRKKAVEDQYDDEIKAIDKVIDKNKEKWASEDYDQNVEKQMSVIDELNKEKNSYLNAALSGDLVAAAKVKELDKEIAEERAKLTETQTNRTRDLQTDALNDMKSSAEEAKDAEIKRLDAVYSETEITANALKSLFADNLAGFTSILTKYLQGLGIAKAEIGKIIESVTKEYSIAKPGVNSAKTSGVSSNELIPYSESLSGSGSKKSPMQVAMEASGKPASEIKADLAKLIALQASWETAKDRNKVNVDANKIRTKYNITDATGKNYPAWEYSSYAKGGKNTTTGLSMLHGTNARPEYILNSNQAQQAVMGNYQNTPLRELSTTNNNNSGIVFNMAFNAPVDKKAIPMLKNAFASEVKKLLVKGGQVRPVVA